MAKFTINFENDVTAEAFSEKLHIWSFGPFTLEEVVEAANSDEAPAIAVTAETDQAAEEAA